MSFTSGDRSSSSSSSSSSNSGGGGGGGDKKRHNHGHGAEPGGDGGGRIGAGEKSHSGTRKAKRSTIGLPEPYAIGWEPCNYCHAWIPLGKIKICDEYDAFQEYERLNNTDDLYTEAGLEPEIKRWEGDLYHRTCCCKICGDPFCLAKRI
jgi:hypothetical protein